MAAEVDLSARPYDGETWAQLSLAETAVVGIFYTLPNLDTTYFDLSLIGPDGHSHLILHSEDYQTEPYPGNGRAAAWWGTDSPTHIPALILTKFCNWGQCVFSKLSTAQKFP